MTRLALLLPIFCLLLPAQSPVAAPVITAALGSAWSSIALPETPLGISEDAGTLWVCGTIDWRGAWRGCATPPA